MRKAREGESTRGGLFALSLGGELVDLPPRKKLNFKRFYVQFYRGFLCVLDQILVVLVTKIFFVS